MVPALLGVTLVVFASVFFPATGPSPSQVARHARDREQVRRDRGLDKPFAVQYSRALVDMLRGEFTQTASPRIRDRGIEERFPATLGWPVTPC